MHVNHFRSGILSKADATQDNCLQWTWPNVLGEKEEKIGVGGSIAGVIFARGRGFATSAMKERGTRWRQ
jgi:hypothetical protein